MAVVCFGERWRAAWSRRAVASHACSVLGRPRVALCAGRCGLPHPRQGVKDTRSIGWKEALCACRTALPREFRGPTKRLFDNVVAPRRHTVGARAQGPGRRGRRSPPSTSSRRASTQRCMKRAVFAHPQPPPAARRAFSHTHTHGPRGVFTPTLSRRHTHTHAQRASSRLTPTAPLGVSRVSGALAHTSHNTDTHGPRPTLTPPTLSLLSTPAHRDRRRRRQ